MYCASLAGSFWVLSAVLGVFFGVLLVIIVSCTLCARCMSCASVLCIFVLCAVHCIVLSVQDVLCLCGALAGADNGFPRLTWRAAAALPIRVAVIIVIVIITVIIVIIIIIFLL